RTEAADHRTLPQRVRGGGAISNVQLIGTTGGPVKSVEEQLALIRRGVDQIEREDELRRKLERSVKTGKPLWVKYALAPTPPDVPVGPPVPSRKMRVSQELGPQAVLIIGTYTALVGAPSGRDETRARLTPEKVETNATEYLNQIRKIIDIDK